MTDASALIPIPPRCREALLALGAAQLDDATLLDTLDSLARAVSARGQAAEAEQLWRRSLAIREARFGAAAGTPGA